MKRKGVTSQCQSCGAFFLTCDWQAHVGLSNITPKNSSPPTSSMHTRRKTIGTESRTFSPHQPQTPSICNPIDYLKSNIQMVQPGKGMAVLRHMTEKRDKYFPTDLRGWERRNCAFVHPDTLVQIEAPARSAVLAHLDAESGGEYEILVLWPHAEVI